MPASPEAAAEPENALAGWWWPDPAAALVTAAAAREGVESWRGESCDC